MMYMMIDMFEVALDCFQMKLLLLLVLAALTCDGGFVWRRHHARRMVARSSRE